MKLLAIDPGLISGYAFWNKDSQRCLPLSAGLIKAGKPKLSWQERILLLANAVCKRLDMRGHPDLVLIERPEFYGVVRPEDRGKLFMLIGVLIQAISRYGVPVELIGVNEWKGQLPKKVVEQRIENVMSENGCLTAYKKLEAKNDAIDAIGIGLWYMGYLK